MPYRPVRRPSGEISLHTETIRDVQAVGRVVSYLDQLTKRFRGDDGPASIRNFYWIGEKLAPVLPNLNKHVHLSRKMKVEAHRLHPDKRVTVGPRGPLP